MIAIPLGASGISTAERSTTWARDSYLSALLRRPGRLSRLRDEHWRRRVAAWREGESFAQRFIGRFEDDDKTIVGRWAIAEDGKNFEADFDLIC
jgi:hypothetical protein